MTDPHLLRTLATRLARLEAQVSSAARMTAATVVSVDDGTGTAVVSVEGVETTVGLPSGFRPGPGDVLGVPWQQGVLHPPPIPAGSLPDAEAAKADAAAALASANGKNTIHHSVSAPSGGGATGDVWFQHDTSLSGPVIGQWHWNGSTWVADQLGHQVIASVDAGTVTVGTLTGIDITGVTITGSTLKTATTGKRIEIDSALQNQVRMFCGIPTSGPGGMLADDDGDGINAYLQLVAPSPNYDSDEIDQSGGTNNIRIHSRSVNITARPDAGGVKGYGAINLIAPHVWAGGAAGVPSNLDLVALAGPRTPWTASWDAGVGLSPTNTDVVYRQVDKEVVASLKITINTNPTATGNAHVYGMPAPRVSSMPVGTWYVFRPGGQVFCGTVFIASPPAQCLFQVPGGGGLGTASTWAWNNFRSGDVFAFQIAYEAA